MTSLVFPEPTVNTRSGCHECAVRLTYSYLVVNVISLVIIRSFFSCRLDVWLAVEFKKKFVARRPGVDESRSFLHVVFDLHPFTGREVHFPRIDLVFFCLPNECAFDS